MAKRLERPLVILLIYFLISFGFDIVGTYYSELNKNNLPLFHLHTIMEFGLLSLVFYQAFPVSGLRKSIPWLVALFSGFAGVYAVFNGTRVFNSIPRAIENVVMIAYAILYLAQLNKHMPVKRLEQFPMFWITTAVLLYFSGTLLLFTLGEYLATLEQHFPIDIWVVHSVLNVVFNILCAVGLWVSRHRSVTASSYSVHLP
ncbi:MAG: hypothetical protein EOP51_25630 [Sphingobacteriales bacterium]|nr:MAG: hypothetical protein EOP51_25630 [Sphingobacteriales bacterium]